MRASVIQVVVLFLTLSVWAQSPELDSLLLSLEKHTAKDSVRAQLLLDIAVRMRRNNPGDALDYYTEAYETAEAAGAPVNPIESQ